MELTKAIGQWLSDRKAAKKEALRKEFKQECESKICITDANVEGKDVIALTVEGVVIGFIYGAKGETHTPSSLLTKMQTIRETEYQRLCKEGGISWQY